MYEDLIETGISSEHIFDGTLLHVRRDKVRLPSGAETVREWIKHPGAAAVLPVLADGQVILVRQYRYPIGEVTLEVPANLMQRMRNPCTVPAANCPRRPDTQQRRMRS
mgnify:CR=1 FL=1